MSPLQLLKNQKLVLGREDGAYCERAVLITSQLLPFSKPRNPLHQSQGVPGAASQCRRHCSLGASKANTACLHIPNHTLFLAYFHLGNSLVGTVAERLEFTTHASTALQNQTKPCKNPVLSSTPKMRISRWRYEEYLSHQPPPCDSKCQDCCSSHLGWSTPATG